MFMKTLIKSGRVVTAVDDYRADILIEDGTGASILFDSGSSSIRNLNDSRFLFPKGTHLLAVGRFDCGNDRKSGPMLKASNFRAWRRPGGRFSWRRSARKNSRHG